MKRVSVFLAVLFMLAFAVTAFAAEDPCVVIDGDLTAKAGETFTLTVSVKNNPGIVGMQVYLGYDSNVMSYVSAEAAANGFSTQTSPVAGANPVKIVLANLSLKEVAGDLSLATVTFRMADKVSAGKYDISVSSVEAFKNNPDPKAKDFPKVAFAGDTATVTVKGSTGGSGSGSGGSSHTHKYTETVVAPQGTEPGYTLYTCSCGHSYKGNYVYSEESVESKTVVKLTIGSSTGYINDEAKTLDAAPVIKNDRTMLPVRFVAEAFGAVVGWDGATSTATITGADGVVIKITIGANTATVGDKTIDLDSPAYIDPVSNRTYLPVRVVAEALGAEVEWDGATSTATLTK